MNAEPDFGTCSQRMGDVGAVADVAIIVYRVAAERQHADRAVLLEAARSHTAFLRRTEHFLETFTTEPWLSQRNATV